MNHVYRVIWNEVLGTWQAVAEVARGRGKTKSGKVATGATVAALSAVALGIAALLGGTAAWAQAALPTGGTVVAGTGSISQSGTVLTVTQGSAKLAADWQSFNIGQGHTVNFVQPSSSAVALNRVLGIDVSVIQGALSANGQVFLVNPNGVLFTPTAQVNVGSIVASTLNISTADFMAGNYKFDSGLRNAGEGQSVINQGNINATGVNGRGGSIALIAARIINTGTLSAPGGNVLLGAGSKVTLDLGGPIKLRVEQGALDALISNGGAIRVDGGLVYMSAKAAGDLTASVINHSGVVDASSLTTKGGRIVLEADSVNLQAGSRLDASGATSGGSIDVQASAITLSSGATLSAKGDAVGGQVRLQADTVVAEQAVVDVSAAAANTETEAGIGGSIDVTSNGSLVLQDTQLLAEGTRQGGQIRLNDASPTPSAAQPDTQPGAPAPLPAPEAPPRVAVLGNSVVSSRSRTGQAGSVVLTGDTITLGTGSHIDATGATGGGTVLVGGDWQGSGPLRQATTVTMEAGASIDASATQNGDGGKVVLWSDVTKSEGGTIAQGTVLAKGGAQGGKGGQVETSGAHLAFDGLVVDTQAADGSAGQWLLDPYNFFLDTTELGTIATNLNTNNITLTTTSGSTGGANAETFGMGQLVFSNDFTYTGSNARTLTLTADKDIWIKGNITATGSGALGLSFNATDDRVLLNGDITTKGGAVSFASSAVNFQKSSGTQSITTAGGALSFNSSNISLLKQDGTVELNTGAGALNLGAGAVYLTSNQYDISAPTKLLAYWGGRHQDGTKTYTDVNIVAGREYATRLYLWNTVSANTNSQVRVDGEAYFGVDKNGNTLGATWDGGKGTLFQTGTDAGQGNVTIVDITFKAINSGKLQTIAYGNNNLQIELNDVWETGLSSNSSFSGSRSLSLTSTSGQITGAKTFAGLAELKVNTNSTASLLSGEISGTGSKLTKQGTGQLTLTANNTHTGVTTIEAGTLVLDRTTASIDDAIFTGAIVKTGTADASLTLKAARNINLGSSASITSSGGKLDVQLLADTNKDGDGIVYVQSSGISTNGGNLTFGQNGQTALIGGETVKVGGDVFFQRGSAQTLSTGGGALNVWGETIVSNTSGLTVNSGGGNVSFNGLLNSGNAYVFQASGNNWDTARASARNGTGGGSALNDSYLVTITSRLENSIAGLAANYQGVWIGNWRANTNNYAWSWADGPEAGQVFFNQSAGGGGTATVGSYANFGTGEPNGNLSGSESVGQFFGTAGQWNDLPIVNLNTGAYGTVGFVRETNLAASPVTINAGVGAVTFDGSVGGAKALASLNVTSSSTTVKGNALVTTGAQTYNNALTVTSTGNLQVSATSLSVTNASQAATFKATGNIATGVNTVVQTNAGAITLWSDSDASGDGSILLNESSRLDSRTAADRAASKTTTASSGGTITLGGGNGAGAADGYASSNGTSGNRGGINFGDETYNNSAHTNLTTLYSGGGNILVRGRSSFGMMGLNWVNGGEVNAGSTGTVTLEGQNTSIGHGIELASWRGSGTATVVAGGGSASVAAISVTGATPHAGGSSGIQSGLSSLQATGAGGITLNGSSGGTGGSVKGILGNFDVLAASGPIVVNGGTSGIDVSSSVFGKKAGTNVTSSSSSITLTGNTVKFGGASTVDTTGEFAVQPFGTSFASALSWPLTNLTLGSAVSGLTLGKSGNTSGITIATATSIAGSINVYGGNIAVNAALTATAGNILLDADTGVGLVFNGSGVNLAAAVTTTNGNITIKGRGGNSNSGDQDGVLVNNVAVTAGGTGLVSVTGRGGIGAAPGGGNHGVRIKGTGGLIKSTNGNITVTGTGGGTGSTGFNIGVLATVGGSIKAGGSGTLSVTGTGGSATGSSQWGLRLDQGAISSAGGAITLTGVGGSNGSSDNDGIKIGEIVVGSTVGSATSGNITMNGTAGSGTGSEGISLESTTVLGAAGYAGNVMLNADSLAVAGTTVTSAGVLTVQSIGTSFSSALNTAGFTLSTALTGLTLGKTTNTTNVTIGSATSVAGPIAIYGGDIAINAGLVSTGTGANALITLKGTGNVTDGVSGYVQTGAIGNGNLLLLGGNVTLDNALNDIYTLAASGVSGLTYIDKLALSIGTVGGTSGVSATGVVNIGTTQGGILVTKNVATTNATGNALTLNASIDSDVGADLTYNLTFSGAPVISVGSGGVAKLYSGSVAGSTGLTALVGSGTGRFRYNSDETTTNFTNSGATALATGLNAIYRERPSATSAVGSQTITYGDALSTLTGTTSGLVNGDTAVYAITSGLYSTSNNIRVSGSPYAVTQTNLAGLGYNLTTNTAGTLTVNAKALTLNGFAANATKVYDGATTATISNAGSLSGLVGSDVVTAANTGATYDNKNVGTGKTVTLNGVSLNSGNVNADAGNYSIGSTATTANITGKALTLAASRAYDGTTTLGTVTLGGFVGSETLTYSAATANDAHVATAGKYVNAITLANGSNGGVVGNYLLPSLTAASAGNAVSFSAATLTPTISNTGVTKLYDGTTNAAAGFTPTYTFTGLMSGDTAATLTHSGAGYNAKDVATGNLVTVSGLALAAVTGGNGSQATDYVLSGSSKTVAATITPAALTVQANNDADLFTLQDSHRATNYQGVGYTGLVGGETSAVLGGALAVTRDNFGIDAAATYANVLTPSGLTSGNYNITFSKGSYTIVAANQLLVNVTSQSLAYGAAPTYTVTGAKYLASDGTTISTPTVTDNGDNSFTVDGVTFTLAATGTSNSAAGKTVVGNYQLGGTVGSGTSSNFSNALTATGALQVNQAGLTASATGVSKTYDGTTSMTGVTLGLTGKEAADVVTVSGTGAFSSADVSRDGSNNVLADKSFNISNLALGGADAGNYYLSAGSSLSGSNGQINAKLLTTTWAGQNKTYDGTTAAVANAASDDRVAGDTLTYANTAVFVDKNFGTSKTVNISGITLGGAQAGNYDLAATTGTATADIAKAGLVLAAVSDTKIYDAGVASSGVVAVTGKAAADTVVATQQFASKNVLGGGGSTLQVVSGYTIRDGSNADMSANYTIADSGTASGTVNKKDITVSASGGVSKTYDGNTSMGGVSLAMAGNLDGTNLTVSGSGSFDDANAGVGNRAYTLTGLALSGSEAGNYALAGGATSVAGTGGTINQRTLTLSAAKTYDGTNVFDTFVTLGNLVSGQALTYSGAAGNSKNVGAGNYISAITLADGIGGAASNYQLPTLNAANAAATIGQANLTVTAATSTKEYERTTSANGSAVVGTLAGAAAGDVVNAAATQAYLDANAGTGKTVRAAGLTLKDGSNADVTGNYAISYVDDTTGVINAKAVTLTAGNASKTYDGLTSYSAQAADLNALTSSLISGDTVTAATITFADKNAGSGNKAVTLDAATVSDGNGGNNYVVTRAGNSTSSIGQANLTVTAATSTKTYDRTTSANGSAVVGALAGAGAGDVVNTAATQAYLDANAGTGKTVRAAGLSLKDGSNADVTGNYAISYVDDTTGVINAKAVTLTAANTSKTYDGLTSYSAQAADLNALTSSLISGDTVTAATITFADKNAGTGNKAVTLDAATVSDGNGGNNYVVTRAGNSTSSISQANLTVTASAATKTYDGTTGASGAATVGALAVAGDLVNAAAIQVFTDKNAGAGNKTVRASGLTIKDAGNVDMSANYAITYVDNTSSTINQAAVTVTANAVSKTYDGTTNATGSATVGTLVSGDSVNASAVLAFTNKDAGTGNKTVQASGLTIKDGSNADMSGNYALTYVDNTVSTITPAALTVRANDDAKFVGVADVTAYNGVSYTGLVGGETAGTAGLTGTLAIARSGGNTAAGTYTSVLGASGLSASNYTITYANGDYTIVPANQLLVKVTNVANIYGTATTYAVSEAKYLATDGSTIVDLLSGVSASGNTITISDGSSGSATFTIAPSAVSTGGAGLLNAGNYALAATAITESSPNFSNNLVLVGNHSVAQKGLTATATGVSKVYDGNTSMTGVSLGLTGKESGDVVTVSGTGAFSSKDAGTSLGYSISNLNLGGADGGNYYLSGGASFIGSDGAITAKVLNVSYSGVNKVYDGNVTATVSASDDRVSGDLLTLTNTSANFADKNVGSGKGVSINGIALTGADASNYSVASTTASASADITAAVLTIGGITAANKTYDATTAASVSTAGATYSGLIAGDVIAVAATGEFVDKNVGAAKLVELTSTYSGADVGNYNITSQASTTANITAASLLPVLAITGYVGNDKVYDGTTTATLSGTGIVNGVQGADVVSLDTSTLSALFADKNVGAAKPITVSGLALGGADAANYAVAQPIGLTANITRLNSVTWTGPASGGNWFDPANWAGGAVPDLSNVANVVIPSGATPVFGTTVVAPAQSGPVNLDTIGSGGSLVQSDGTLNVGSGGMTLSGFTQSGGALTNAGNTTLNSFNQSGGNFAGAGNLTVAQEFSQGTSGSVSVGGNTQITDTSGGVQLGNLTSAGALTVNSTDGAITQAAATAITAQSSSNLTATQAGSPAAIALTNAGNDFTGAVSLSGAAVQISDANALTLGTATTSGNLTLNSGGNLDLGTSTVGGNLNANSAAGNITQSGTSLVAGTTTISAPQGSLPRDFSTAGAAMDAAIQNAQQIASNLSLSGPGAPDALSRNVQGLSNVLVIRGGIRLPEGVAPLEEVEAR